MEQRNGTGKSTAEALPGGRREARGIVLVARWRQAPRALIASFRRRGVEVSIEHEPLLALAELGRCLIEHRQRCVRGESSFHRRVSAAASAHPALILVVAEPGDFPDVGDLLECAARSMPSVAIAVFEEAASPNLRMIRSGVRTAPAADAPVAGPARQAARLGQEQTEPPQIVVRPARSARPALRLASRNDSSPLAAPGDDADRVAAASPHTDEAPAAQDTPPEPLITDEELAMLLGDDEAADEAPRAGGAA